MKSLKDHQLQALALQLIGFVCRLNQEPIVKRTTTLIQVGQDIQITLPETHQQRGKMNFTPTALERKQQEMIYWEPIL